MNIRLSVTAMESLTSKTYDFYYSAGVGLRWRFHAFAYADAGVHWQQILHKKLALGGFVPEISIGFRY